MTVRGPETNYVLVILYVLCVQYVTVINCCSEEKLSVPFEFEFVLPDGNMELLLSGKIENCKEVVSEKGNMEDILEVETVARLPIDHSLKAH